MPDGTNLELHHETLQQATDEMRAAAASMHENLNALITGLQQMPEAFQGEAALAFQHFLKIAHDNDAQMSEEFDKGHQLLTQMHEDIRSADKTGAARFQ